MCLPIDSLGPGEGHNLCLSHLSIVAHWRCSKANCNWHWCVREGLHVKGKGAMAVAKEVTCILNGIFRNCLPEVTG